MAEADDSRSSESRSAGRRLHFSASKEGLQLSRHLGKNAGASSPVKHQSPDLGCARESRIRSAEDVFTVFSASASKEGLQLSRHLAKNAGASSPVKHQSPDLGCARSLCMHVVASCTCHDHVVKRGVTIVSRARMRQRPTACQLFPSVASNPLLSIQQQGAGGKGKNIAKTCCSDPVRQITPRLP